MLSLLGFTDAFYGYIYPLTYLLIIPTLILHPLHPITAVIIYGMLLLISRQYSLGLGDIEVISLISLIVGLNTTLWILMLACLACIISYLVYKKRSFRFIPYLSLATGIIHLIFSFNG